jgi:hypothetical protein
MWVYVCVCVYTAWTIIMVNYNAESALSFRSTNTCAFLFSSSFFFLIFKNRIWGLCAYTFVCVLIYIIANGQSSRYFFILFYYCVRRLFFFIVARISTKCMCIIVSFICSNRQHHLIFFFIRENYIFTNVCGVQ